MVLQKNVIIPSKCFVKDNSKDLVETTCFYPFLLMKNLKSILSDWCCLWKGYILSYLHLGMTLMQTTCILFLFLCWPNKIVIWLFLFWSKIDYQQILYLTFLIPKTNHLFIKNTWTHEVIYISFPLNKLYLFHDSPIFKRYF